MPRCPMVGWYEGNPNTRESKLVISSVVEGSLIVPKKGNARIVTRIFETHEPDPEKGLECAVDPDVRTMFSRAGAEQDYGLIIFRPKQYRKLSGLKVVDFISFHRHPTKYTSEPTSSRFGVTDYTEVFDELALKGLSRKKAQYTKARKRVIKENLPPLVRR